MAIYRNVHLSFWDDAKVVDDFTPEDRYFMLYILTNPHTNLCGCYEISIKKMETELGYTRDSIENLINRFKNFHNVIDYDYETKELLVNNWHKYNWTASSKLDKPLRSEIENIKSIKFKRYLADLYNKRDSVDDTVSIQYQYGIDTTDTVPVTDTVTDTDTDTDTVTEKKCIQKSSNNSSGAVFTEEERINYQIIANMYNDTCVSFPRLTKLSDARKKSIKARLKAYSLEEFQKMFTMAEESSFLKGQNNRNWSATFDWMIKDSNMAKILDGNYADNKNSNNGGVNDGQSGCNAGNDEEPNDMVTKLMRREQELRREQEQRNMSGM